MGNVITEGAEEAFSKQIAEFSGSSAGWWCRHIKISSHIDANANPDIAGVTAKIEATIQEKEITVFLFKDKDFLILYKPAEKDIAMRLTNDIWNTILPSYDDKTSGQDKQYNEDLSALDDTAALTTMAEEKKTHASMSAAAKKVTVQEAKERMAARSKREEKKFLLIASEPDLISAIYSAIPLKDIEQEYKKADIISASDLQDAIQKYYEHFPDIVLIDDGIKTGLKSSTGKEVYKWIQYFVTNDPEGYIMLLSEHAATAYTKKMLHLGCKALIRKPFTTSTITKHVAYALESKKKTQENVASSS